MPRRVSYEDARQYLFAIEAITRGVGEALLGLNWQSGRITDTHDIRGHESSTIDAFARERIVTLIEQFLPNFHGDIRLELDPYHRQPIGAASNKRPLMLIIDEIEGTTNAKRCQASVFDYRPHSGISIALSTSGRLGDLIASSFYALDQGEVFSAISVGSGCYAALRDRTLIDPADIVETRGDSKRRIIVAGYSNGHRLKKGELEQVLYDCGLKVYDGCRASGMDIINLVRNSFDAYVDLRHFWSTKAADGREKEAMLQVYDIAGVIAFAAGCGLAVSDATGGRWQNYAVEDTIPLVVARPDIHQQILDTIAPLVASW